MPKPQKSRAASMVPTDMSKPLSGLADNFDATVTSATMEHWNYSGKRDWSIFVRLKLQPDEDSGLTEQQIERLIGDGENDGQFYSLTKSTMTSRDGEVLNTWQVSEDGVDGLEFDGDPTECVGYYAVPTDEYVEWWAEWRKSHPDQPESPQLQPMSNWAFFMAKLIDSGFPVELIRAAEGGVQFLEGAKLHFVRVPPPPRPGMPSDAGEGEQKKGDNKILVVTDVIELPGGKKAKGKVAGKAAPTPAPAAKGKAAAKAASNGNDINELVEAAIVAKLEEEGEPVKRRSLYKVATSAVESPKDKKAALALMADDDFFLASELFELDPADDTVSLVEG